MSILKKTLEANGYETKPEDNANNSTDQNASEKEITDTKENADTNAAASGEAGAGAAAGQSEEKKDPPTGASEAPASQPELTNEAVLNFLKKNGIEVGSISEITKKPTEEPSQVDKDKAAEAKRSSIRAFGLQNGKVTTTELDSYARDINTHPTDLAYDIFKKQRLAELKAEGVAEDKMPTDEALYKDFADYNYLEADEKDPKRVRREKELELYVDNYLKNTYKNIYGLESDYNEHETVQQARSSYNGHVAEAFKNIPTELSFSFPDVKDASGKTQLTYKVKPSPEVLRAIQESYNSDAMFSILQSKNVDDKFIAEAIQNELILKDLPRVIAEVANAHATAEVSKVARGRRNMMDSNDSGASDQGSANKNPALRKLLESNKNLISQ
jgi:hypothetical protein